MMDGAIRDTMLELSKQKGFLLYQDEIETGDKYVPRTRNTVWFACGLAGLGTLQILA